ARSSGSRRCGRWWRSPCSRASTPPPSTGGWPMPPAWSTRAGRPSGPHPSRRGGSTSRRRESLGEGPVTPVVGVVGLHPHDETVHHGAGHHEDLVGDEGVPDADALALLPVLAVRPLGAREADAG